MIDRNIRLGKARLKRLIVSGCCMIVFVTAQVLSYQMTAPVQQRLLQEKWSESGQYSQLTLFFSDLTPMSAEEIQSFRQSIIEDYMHNADLTVQGENSALFSDACSFDVSMTVKTEKSEAETIVTVVDGDYFWFQPVRLLHGAYFWGEDDYTDLVVIDELLAWKLYGSSAVSGMAVTIDSKPFIVSGVVKEEGLYTDEELYGKTPRMYMQYPAYQKLIRSQAEVNAAALESSNRSEIGGINEKGFTVYQVLLPEPVKNHAITWTEEQFSASDKILEIQIQGSRFSVSNLFHILGSYGKRSLSQPGLCYPYWENAVRLAEDYAVLLLMISVLSLLFPLYTILGLFISKRKAICQKIFLRHLSKHDGIECGK